MLDKYFWGVVGRISPEAPVPVVRGIHQNEKPGGAANVAMNLAHLGAQTVVAGFTGDDENERLLAASLSANGIASHFIQCEGFPTIKKTRILGGRQQMFRLDIERVETRAQADYDHLIETALKLLPGSDALVISDYAKGAITCRRSCRVPDSPQLANSAFLFSSIPKIKITLTIAAPPPYAQT